MHVAASARLVLARRPWVYWAVVVTLAVLVATIVHREVTSVAASRDRWGTTRSVLVAQQQLEPGDPLAAELVEVPLAVLPDGALGSAASGSVVRQRVAAGAIVTDVDVTTRAGPASIAQPGTVVVAVSDALARDVTTGLRVQIAADGVILAGSATVSAVIDDVVFVAVPEREAPVVAAAAQQGIASLLYLP
jgi:hypothetical protein